MAVKYLAGDRLIGTAAERTALTTSVDGSPTANAWKEIKRFTATGSQNELDTGTFPAKDNLMFLIYIPIVSNNHDPKLTFNGDSDSATTYDYLRSTSGAAAATTTGTYFTDLYMHGGDAAQFVVGEIRNIGTHKNFRYQGVASGTAGNTACSRREWYCAYNNSSAITSMKVDIKNILMVGDDLDADIGGAQSLGIKAAQVQTGKFTNNDIKRKDIRSDYRIESIADLETLLLKLG